MYTFPPNAIEGLRKLQGDINGWQDRTFPRSTLQSTYRHLTQEVEELGRTAEGEEAEELADVFILVCAVAGKCGVDLAQAVSEKMRVNLNRVWLEPDEHGVVYHEK